ncbi:MAG: lipoate--protein ligase [Clostridia bacterium]|nr:lipoate--protein ligase [Clostridia bacterium]
MRKRGLFLTGLLYRFFKNMITKTTVIQSNTVNPYYNLALEEYLVETVEEGECILYLWQNDKTVVIGKNQNAWAQCNLSLLEQAGGFLARRSSGGGAVYHDMGNLNFTFVAHNEDYNVSKQLDVIARAVKEFGIDARKTGRNDITVSDKKISGNAFHKGSRASCHHGTLLINSDMDALSKYLNVSEKKLRSKGVDSVRSRVVNLSSLGDVSTDSMKEALIISFSEVYGVSSRDIDVSRLNYERIEEIRLKYASDEWRLGRNPKFSFNFDNRFDWGEIQVCLDVENEKVKKCKVYSDALDVEFVNSLEGVLVNTAFSKAELTNAILSLNSDQKTVNMVKDVAEFLGQQNI